jgi:hypothetical protein
MGLLLSLMSSEGYSKRFMFRRDIQSTSSKNSIIYLVSKIASTFLEFL